MPVVRFCSECQNMLFPVEDKQTRRETGKKQLIFLCRNCQNRENVTDITVPVYRNVVSHSVSEKAIEIYDVANDPTLPRTYNVQCDKCGHREAVYYQSPVGKNDEASTLYLVCAKCSHSWLSSDV